MQQLCFFFPCVKFRPDKNTVRDISGWWWGNKRLLPRRSVVHSVKASCFVAVSSVQAQSGKKSATNKWNATHWGESKTIASGRGRLLSWTKVNRSLSETAKSSDLQYKQCSRKNKIQGPLNGVYVYEVGKNGGERKDLRRYTEMWKLSGICTCLYIYIYIYLC